MELGSYGARRGVAATAAPEATAAAMEILAAGGNAIDAAAAAAWALCVCEPSGSGLGGHTTLLLRHASGSIAVIEGQSRAPKAASLSTIRPRDQRYGRRAATIPSTPAVLTHTQLNFGVLPPEQVFQPAIRLASEGFEASPLFRKQLSWTAALLRASRSSCPLLTRSGTVPQVGERIRQPALAETLRRLASYGSEDFYFGQTAARIVEDMQNNGGLIASEDLARAAIPLQREPISMDYRGHRVITAPPPAGGARLLNALEKFSSHPDAMHDTCARWYSAIAQAVYASIAEDATDAFARAESCGETTHLCVSDAEGNVVALSQSIQSLFGAKVVNPKLGFFYNNYLRTCPRTPHESQLCGRCQPRSNIAPTLILKNGEPVLTLGAAGSRRIISSILQVLSLAIDRGIGIREAVAAPRIHALANRRIWIESPAATEPVLEELARSFAGCKIKSALNFTMGSVQAIQFGADGSAIGAADPRRQGCATFSPPRSSECTQKLLTDA